VKVREAYPDDYIRGFIAALKWAIEWPDQEMNAAAILAQEEMRMPLAVTHTEPEALWG
jgi:hypothetical protein